MEGFILGEWATLGLARMSQIEDARGNFYFNDYLLTTNIGANTPASASDFRDELVFETGGTGSAVSTSAGSSYVNSTNNALGVLALSTGTSNGGGAACFSNVNSLAFSYAVHNWKTRVRIPVLATVAQNFLAFFGFSESTSTFLSQTQIGLVHNRTISTTNWLFFYQKAWVATYVDTGIAINPNQWYTISLDVTPTTITAYVDAAQVFTSSLSTVYDTTAQPRVGYGQKIRKTVGTTNTTILVDYTRHECLLTTER